MDLNNSDSDEELLIKAICNDLPSIPNENNAKTPEKEVAKKEIFVHDEDELLELESYCSQLKTMFPNVDEDYIKRICVEPPFDDSEGDKLLMLINHLLSYDEKIDESELLREMDAPEQVTARDVQDDDLVLSEALYFEELANEERRKQDEAITNERLLSEMLQQESSDVQWKMKIIENVLPDANPDEIKKFIEDENLDIDEFVVSKLEARNYEKRDQYFTNLRKKDIAERYTTGFNVEAFVKEFPEPFAHFEDPNRQCYQQEQALLFLKSGYESNNHQYVLDWYKYYKFNLSLTCYHLKKVIPRDQSLELSIPTDSIPVLQEIAFIQNRDSIKQYLETVKQKEEKELQILRKSKLLLECQCCYDDLKPYECIECDNQHLFCKKCIIRGTNAALSSGESAIYCFNGCGKEISLSILKKVLPESTFETLLKNRQETEINAAKLDNLVQCPFCPFAMEIDPQIQIFTCKNPECMKISCRKCKKMNHLPVKCEDVLDEHKGRLYVQEEMSKALIRYCYNCQKPYIKDHGCNFMTCKFCRAKWCYICKQPITSHDHVNYGACRQNSDIFDEDQVQLKRTEAVEKLRNQFPDLKLSNL